MAVVLILLTIGVLCAVGLLCLPVFGYLLEKKEWNKGKCQNCDAAWESFDMDSQGGRGYKCPCGRHIWISYPWVDGVHGTTLPFTPLVVALVVGFLFILLFVSKQ